MEEEEIAEVEMLLEAYFMHVDNTYNRWDWVGGNIGLLVLRVRPSTCVLWSPNLP